MGTTAGFDTLWLPPMLTTSSNALQESFAILEIPGTASLQDARLSYKDLVRIWHPDRFQTDERLRRRCEEKIKRINAAFAAVETALASAAPWQTPQARTPRPPQPESPLQPVLLRGKWGFADRQGSVRIPAVYDSASEFNEGLAAVSQGGAFGYVSRDGSLAIDLRFSAAGRFSEGFAMVRFGRCGYINRDGEWAIKPRFEAGLPFCDNVAAVKVDGKWGLIDRAGLWVMLPRFDEMREFESGRALAGEGARSYWVYTNGEVRPL